MLWSCFLGVAFLFHASLAAAESEATEPAEAAPAEAAPAEATPPPKEPEPEASPDPTAFHGDFSQRYRFRKSHGDIDQDLFGAISLTGEHAFASEDGKPLASKLGFNFQGSYTWDIDSFQDPGGPGTAGFNPFFDIGNTYSERVHGYLYEANLEAKDFLVFETTKVGRQSIWREENLFFDGLYARTKRWNTLTFDVYGGLPVHLYESSPSGDALGGFGIESRPIPGLSLGGNYVYLRDQRSDGPDSSDSFYLINGRYNFLREWTVGATASWVDTRDRRQTVELRYLSEASGFSAQFRGMRQNGIVEFANEISPYVIVMGDYAPFYQCQLDLHQPIGEQFGIGGGTNLRQLEHPSDSGLYNHSYMNFYLSFDVAKLWEGMRLNVRGDWWESDGDDIYTAGLELAQDISKIATARVGTSYSLYKFDLFTGEERERDRVYYVKVRWHATRHLDIDTEYQYETDSDSEYHVALGGVRIWF